MKNTDVFRSSLLLLTLLLVFAGAPSLRGQGSFSSIEGTVSDSTGARIPLAHLELRNDDTGVVTEAVSDGQGRYAFANISLGHYTLTSSGTGFETSIRKGIAPVLGVVTPVDFTMPLGTTGETVTVEGSQAATDTTTPALGTLVEQTQMRELPLNGRNITQLFLLAPGVQTVAASGGSLYGRGTNYSVSGSRPEGQLFFLDRANLADFFGHSTGSSATGTSLGAEALIEFQVLTNTYSAEFGGNGAVILAASKSGTNAFHGSAYEYVRNSAFDARNYFDPATIPGFRRNQFGGSIGGPIRKDKLFFFLNYEGLRQLQGLTKIATVPDANARLGFLPCAIATGYTCGTNGLAYVGVASNIASTLALYTQTSLTNVATGVVQVPNVASEIAHENYVLTRLDAVLSPRDSVFMRYISDRGNFYEPFPNNNGSIPVPLWPEADKTANDDFTLEWRRTVSASLLNLARVSYLRPVESGATVNSVPALQFYSTPTVQDGNVQVGGGISTLGPGSTLPFGLFINHFVFDDDVIYTKGRGTINAGISVDRTQDNTFFYFHPGDTYVFNGILPLLKGTPASVSGPIPGHTDARRDFRELFISPYVQLSWKLSDKLTLDAGVRYEFAINPTAAGPHPLYNIVDPVHDTAFTQVSHVFSSNPTKGNFSPRIGVAYDVFGDHKTALRAGFGIFHDLLTARDFTGYDQSPPYLNGSQTNPTYPNPFAGGAAPGLPTTGQQIYYGTNKTPYIMQYNLNVQRQFGAATILTVAYVGALGKDLLADGEFNPPTLTTNAAGQAVLATCCTATGGIITNPRVNPALSDVILDKPIASSNYNSLQVGLNRQLRAGLQGQVSYTYSRALDNNSVASGLEQVNGSQGPYENPYNIDMDYGRSVFDRTHNLHISGVYVVPFKGNPFFEGFQVSGIFSAVSGLPYSVQTGFDQAGLGFSNANERPNFVAGRTPKNAVQRITKQWYDPTAFSLPGVGLLGVTQRNNMIGPRLFDTDMSFSKTTKIPSISELFSVELRGEFFNIFNHTNFGLPSTSVFTSSGSGNGTYSGTAGTITSTLTSNRQTQLVVRFNF